MRLTTKSLALALPLFILGAGCTSQSQTAKTTDANQNHAAIETTIVRNTPFDSLNGYVILQGALFSDATTTLYLHREGLPEKYQKITGRYIEDSGKNIGLIVGQDPLDGDVHHLGFVLRPLADYFHNGAYEQYVTAQWNDDGRELRGTIKNESDQTMRPFTLRIVDQKDIPDSANLAFQRILQSWTESPWINHCEYAIEYPHVETRDGHASSERIDKEIVATLLEPGATSLKQQVERFIQGCKTDFPGSDQFGETGNRSHNISTEIAMNERDILSLFFHVAHWEGGAHGSFESKAVTIDLKTGNRLKLSDIIAPEHLHAFIEAAGRKTLDQEYEQLKNATPPIGGREKFDKFEDFNDLRKLMAATENLTVAEQLKRYGDFKNFYLTPAGIVVFYNSYELGMWANTPHILLPYEEIKSFMRQNGPLNRLYVTSRRGIFSEKFAVFQNSALPCGA